MKRLPPKMGMKFGSKGRHRVLQIKAEHYDRMIEIMGYPEDMSRSYERWRQIAEGLKRRLQSKGYFVVPVIADPDKFLAWCVAKDISPDRQALDGFVNRPNV